MPDNSVHAIVTDPPYGLSNTTPEQVADTIVRWVNGDREHLPSGKGFMGKSWDGFVPPVAVWDEAMRVLKPGGHVLAFAGTRTVDLMTLGLRLAGFDIRESIAWMYGSGMPKSHNLKEDWQGWGTAMKPSHEPIVMARKPFKGTVAMNVREHGTGAINVDACRVGTEVRTVRPVNGGTFKLDGCQSIEELRHLASLGAKTPSGRDARTTLARAEKFNATSEPREYAGRWPANVILDEHMARVLDEQVPKTSTTGKRSERSKAAEVEGTTWGVNNHKSVEYTDSGGASRFFYVAKASKRERPDVDGIKHPTVKPLSLMRWLVRLVTPPNGIVLDSFAGSGTTIEAAMLEGFDCIGIEREAEYLPLIQHRIDRATEQLRTEQEAQAEAPDQGAFPLEDIA
jgi:DNA modification methylase